MAVVYLPYGYPLQSGVAYDTLVYQGDVVRQYTLPIDPRSNEQLFNRRLLSDTSKVRRDLQDWGRQACKTVFGSKWPTVIYQLLRADEGGVWSDGLAAWNGFTTVEQAAWRSAAPYQATFNDPGRAFYMYARCVAQVLLTYSGVLWGSAIWGSSDSANALAWWNKDLSDAMVIGVYGYNSAFLSTNGNWATVTSGSDHYLRAQAVGDWYEFYYYAKKAAVRTYYISGQGEGDVFVDGIFNQHAVWVLGENLFEIEFPSKGLHLVRFEASAINTQMWDITIVK